MVTSPAGRKPLGRALAAVASLARPRGSTSQPPDAAPRAGVVVLPFGRYFASRADLLTREGFKTVAPMDGVSPFSAVGEPDPGMRHLAEGERTNDRVVTEVTKGLAQRLADAQADFLVVDNTTALLRHRHINGRWYTVVPGERTTLSDVLAEGKPSDGPRRIYGKGLTDDLRHTYDAFVEACTGQFPPSRVILIRSHLARFWVDDDGVVAPTRVDRAGARFLDELDHYFASRTGCRVASSVLHHVPSSAQWHQVDHRLRRAIEDELVDICRSTTGTDDDPPPALQAAPRRFNAADHIANAVRRGRGVRKPRLRRYFREGALSSSDLLALVYLQQHRSAVASPAFVRTCVRAAVNNETSLPRTVTDTLFDASLQALRSWQWRSVPIDRAEPWRPQITIHCGNVVLRFTDEGSVVPLRLGTVALADAQGVVTGDVTVTPHNLMSVLSSWPVYIERARRGITAAPTVVVRGPAELVDSCYWLDWSRALHLERVVIIAGDPPPFSRTVPSAKTDLSFVFDPTARVGTVAGGLMDQVTHIALFEELCMRHGVRLYLDDLRYIWWQSHNGFEASRLAPHLEQKRITRLISQALIESFREDVGRTRLPWVYNQSRTWFDMGLREAVVVTSENRESRRLVESNPHFPVHVYGDRDDLERLLADPPSPVCFFTTLQRIRVIPESVPAIRRVFSYSHLLSRSLDADVADTATVLRESAHVALHIRRGDYLNPHFDKAGWHSQQDHYVQAIEFLIRSELGTRDFKLAVFSDDLTFVEAHASDYGIDLVNGDVTFVSGNSHYRSIYDSYLMSLCPIIVGSVGWFAATTSLLADPPSVFIRAEPGNVRVEWRL